jgi:hypothetical protein
MSPARMFSDHYMVVQIEQVLVTRPTDHYLGLKVRLLFDAREDDRRKRARQPELERDEQGWPILPGAISLPDEPGPDAP